MDVPKPFVNDGCRSVGDAAWREPLRCVRIHARAGMVQQVDRLIPTQLRIGLPGALDTMTSASAFRSTRRGSQPRPRSASWRPGPSWRPWSGRRSGSPASPSGTPCITKAASSTLSKIAEECLPIVAGDLQLQGHGQLAGNPDARGVVAHDTGAVRKVRQQQGCAEQRSHEDQGPAALTHASPPRRVPLALRNLRISTPRDIIAVAGM